VDRVRFASYAVAAVVVLLSLAASVGDVGDNAVFLLPVLAVPVSIAVATLRRSWSAIVLAIGAFVAATWSPDVPSLWLAMAVLVFGSPAEDRQTRPWMGWAGGLGGASFSIFLYDSGNFAPFLATALGGAAGLLLRSRARTTELVGEAEELRGQAAWLEQRTSVARELHDVVGHHVTAMVVQAEAGQLGDPRDALKAIGDLGRTALAELDSLVVHLRDPGAPLTVSAPPRLLDIDELLAEPLRRAGMVVDVRLDDEPALAEADVLTVYRITQEALTNVARHSGASHAWVEVSKGDTAVRLRVSDDGAGPPAERTRGSGLLGIEERVAARGGRMELIGRPGGGTMLDVTFPLGDQ
jgi:signal transduction histidine kinase